MKPKNIFLDFDDTITCIDPEEYFDENLGMLWHRQKVKNNVNQFLKFLTKHFNVVWCSYNSKERILEQLTDRVDKDILDKIKYFNCHKHGFGNKVYEINEVTSDYLFIDDSWILEEQEIIPNTCYFIQACETDPDDLIRIENEIRYKYKIE